MNKFIILIAIAVFAVACQTTGAVPDPGANAQPEIQQRAEYRLGTGDQVRVIVYNEESLSGEFVVDGSGRVSLPLIGQIDAGGLSLTEFEDSVELRLSDGYLNDPRVNVEVLNFRPFYILGEVEEAGEYPYTDGLTVMNAVATAGGFTYRANTRVVYIKRDGTDHEVAVSLTPGTPVNPGDTIRIAERYF
ncbi:polysaccharide biosynthesis/export family protein [Maricaulis alexandrii]|uniref:polysaccharide biosynthesis/export family protein n=1 Tax=Maricaulis alexandrii TaxID=2570354 RepID=UPI001F415670|nr:polysaccharide biosynthesis/export family protein [Maricaulis alexandrii]